MLRTIGLMSGTSLDGVDAAYLETDGEAIARFGPRQTLPYDPALRRALRALLDRAESLTPDDPALLDATRRLTERHAEAVEAIGLPADLIGFHGQTILHRPVAPGRTGTPLTWQIGDAAMLARRTGMSVAYDFRSADVAAGGQGAPLVPVFHRALAAPLPKPLAILNLGGVGNVTWLGPDGEMLAFDTGPANGPLDDWARQHTGKDYDAAGKLALAGQADGAVLGRLMAHPIWQRRHQNRLTGWILIVPCERPGRAAFPPRMARPLWLRSARFASPPPRGISRNRRCNGWWRVAGGVIPR